MKIVTRSRLSGGRGASAGQLETLASTHRAGVAGIINYHGVPVPLIDLLATDIWQACRKWMSTRIIAGELSGGFDGRDTLARSHGGAGD